MKDMFDFLEEGYNEYNIIYLVKTIKNKRRMRRKIYYLETIALNGKITWTSDMDKAIKLFPKQQNYPYSLIKGEIRKQKISCQILKIPNYITILNKEESKSVRKGWWRNFKMWFFQKFRKKNK